MTPTRSSPLNIACRFRNEEILRLFLDHGGNPLLMHNTDGNTLHIIAKGSERRIAELIFEGSKTKIPVNTADVYGMTPLHHAAQTGNMEMCKWLLMHKAKPRVKDFRKGTPFHLACRQGHINIMTLLLQADSSEKKQLLHLMADADDEGNTALHHACLDNRMQVVKTLLDWGADANVLNKSHWVPLHFCALNDHKELVPELLRHRADPETRDIHGRTPLHIAAGYRKIDTISALVDGGAKINERDTENSTPLLIACKKGHIDVVKLLITLGADLTIRGSFDKTCLHIATEEGHAEVLHVLLENCDSRLVEAQDIFNQNALHVAAVQKNAILARTLIQHGCSANEREIVGRIPLHLAAGLSSYETVITVAEATKDVNQECYDMKSPFFMACETGNRPAITALIEKGAIIRDTDTFFRNTLMVAAIGGYSDIVEDLIKMGIQVETKDKERNTALHYACAHGHLTTVSALLHHGAKVSDINVYGQSPLDMAVDREMSDVAVFLMQHYTWEESMSVKDKHGRTCLDRMIRKTPLAVKVLLDNCMKTSNNQEVDEEYTVELNYRYIDPLPDKHITEYLHNNPLLTMLEKEREDLLSHPVCQGLLSYKWHIYGRLSLFMNLTMQFVFIGLVVFLFFISFHKPTKSDRSHDCDFVKGMSANETGTRQEFHETHLFVIEILLYITMAMLYIKELSHAFIVGWRFLFSFQFFNLTVSLSLMVYATSPPGYKPCATQWRAVAYSLFLFFLLTIWMYQRIDFIGLYFSMFFEVLHTMLKLLLLMFFFLVLFAVPMYVMLDVEGFRKGQPFILTVLAMTTGELNFRDNFVLPDNTP
ncbi:serine/threonine-protein phosphatase 6 regulatory ankyrin repeat subunit A, partial [Aplysia californica]|uniref:Serine/threonine-protein phosphatase 6 regulatory ankyrin repeat subunit A n=1 Tax=Aplysia californica TaxID=6500 RepID=A0ABM0ZVU2_APLCA